MRYLRSGLHDSLWTQLLGSIRKELMEICNMEKSGINIVSVTTTYYITITMTGTYIENRLVV